MSDDSKRFYEELGMNIRVGRTRKRMRQRELAEAVGVGAVTVCRWESGDRRITALDLLKVCNALDQQVGDILPATGGDDA